MLQDYCVSHFHIERIQDVVSEQQANKLRLLIAPHWMFTFATLVSNCRWEAQQATGGYCNCTTQTNQFTHYKKNSDTHTRKTMHFQVSVKCQSKQMSCSLSHTPTILWLYSCFCPYSKWDTPMRRRAAWSPGKWVSRDKFQDVRGAVSGKEYTGHCHFQTYLLCNPTTLHPQDEQYFPTVKDYLVSLHHFTLWGTFADISSTQGNCGLWPVLQPLCLETNVPVRRMICLN